MCWQKLMKYFVSSQEETRTFYKDVCLHCQKKDENANEVTWWIILLHVLMCTTNSCIIWFNDIRKMMLSNKILFIYYLSSWRIIRYFNVRKLFCFPAYVTNFRENSTSVWKYWQIYSKTCIKWPLLVPWKIDLLEGWLLNRGRLFLHK